MSVDARKRRVEEAARVLRLEKARYQAALREVFAVDIASSEPAEVVSAAHVLLQQAKAWARANDKLRKATRGQA